MRAPLLRSRSEDDVSRKWRVAQVAQSPRSTVVGLCVLALAAERGVHFDSAGHLTMTARDWFDVACGALTAVVSGLSQDAEEITPGSSQDRSTAQP